MSFDESVTVVEAVAATDLDRCYVGGGDMTPAMDVRRTVRVDIQLRRRRPTDPPIVLVLPLLIAAADDRTVGQTAS